MQRRFTNYKDPVNSFPLGEMTIGLFKPGRYNGFDTMSIVGGLTITLDHDGVDNVEKTLINGTPINFGALKMPSGTVIHEDEPLEFVIDTNAGNTNIRRDLIICEHEYIEVVGGVEATYLIIKGDNLGNMPELPNPSKQIIMGYLEIPALATDATGFTWNPTPVPLLGDQTIEKLWQLLSEELPVASTTTEGITRFATAPEVTARTVTDKAISPASIMGLIATSALAGISKYATEAEVLAGLSFNTTITPATLRNYGGVRNRTYYTAGTGVVPGNVTIPQSWMGGVIIFNGDVAVVPEVTVTIPTGLPAVFSCKLIGRTQNVKLVTATGVVLLKPEGKEAKTKELGSELILERISSGETYTVNGALRDTSSTGFVPMRTAVPYFPENGELGNFNGTGLGITGDVIGWAICNGQNNTVDLRGRFLVGYDPGDTSYNAMGKVGGAKEVTLTLNQMPRHRHELGMTSPQDDGSGRITTGQGEQPGETLYSEYTGGNNGGTTDAHENRPPFYTTIYIQRVS